MISRTSLLLIALILGGGLATACETRVEGTSYASKLKYRDDAGEDDDDDAADDDDDREDDDDDDNAPKPSPPKKSTSSPPPASGDAGAPAVTNAFQSAPAYTEMTLATDTSRHHLGDNNAGRNCGGCHDGSNSAPSFVAGGTVRLNGGAPEGATGVQVRIVDSSGAEVALMGTDSLGNFWRKGKEKIPAGSHVAIRSGSVTKAMNGTISNGSCNSAGCHDPNRPIFLNAK